MVLYTAQCLLAENATQLVCRSLGHLPCLTLAFRNKNLVGYTRGYQIRVLFTTFYPGIRLTSHSGTTKIGCTSTKR